MVNGGVMGVNGWGGEGGYVVLDVSSITCAVDQRGHGTLLRKHALHPTGLLGVVKAEEVGFTQTQRITWGQK